MAGKPKKSPPKASGVGDKPKKIGRPTIWTEEKALELGRELVEWMLADESRTYWQRFIVIEKGLYKELINDLVKKWPSFSPLLKRAKEIQELRLLETVGKGEIKSLFVLKNHHGYADRVEVKSDNLNRSLDTKDLSAASDEQLREMLKSMVDSKQGD